jgi:ATP-dependent helicase/nuclease subunit B
MMAHRIYAGSFASLENRLMLEFEERQGKDPLAPAAVLVGSNLLATYLRRRYAEERRAAVNIRYYTFLDLAEHLAGRKGIAEAKPLMPRLGASVILESALFQQTPDVFKPVSGYLGFRNALLDTFRDLRDAGINASQLEDSIRLRIRHQPDRRDYLAGLARLYREFRRRGSAFRDVDDDFRTAIGKCADARNILGTQFLIVYGIYDATGQQIELLTSLKDCLDMIYFIPFVNDKTSRFAFPFLESREQELNKRREHLVSDCQSSGLASLRAANFRLADEGPFTADSSSHKPIGADGSFVLVSAPGESRVALEATREILAAVRDGIIAGFHEAAIILRQPQEELPLFVEAFRLRNIPFFVDGGIPLAERPLSKAAIALFSLAANSSSRQSILTAMEFIGASLPAEESAKWDVTRWRAITNDPRFLSGIASWDASTRALVMEARRDLQAAEALAGALEDEEETRILPTPLLQEKLQVAEALENGWKTVRLFLSSIPTACSWDRWAEILEKDLSLLLGSSADWRSFAAVIDEVRSLDPVCRAAGSDEPVSLTRFIELLEGSLEGLRYPMGKFQRSGVNLLPISAARGLRFPLVIIPGLEEGKFPARLRQDPLLLDEERKQISFLPLKKRRGEEEEMLFDMAARSADSRLVLIASRLDESSDRECLPSRFFMDFASAVCGKPTALGDLSEGTIPGFRSVSLENPSPGEGSQAIDDNEIRIRAICSSPGSAQGCLDMLAGENAGLLAGPLKYDRARWQRRLTTYDGRFQDSELIRWAAEKSLPANGQISASRIEQYAKCPYQFYLKRVMGLERWEENETIEAMDPLAKGSIVHKILERFLKEHAGGKFLHTSFESLQKHLEERGRELLEEERPVGLPDLLWEIERDRILQTLRNWLAFEKSRQSDGFLPIWLERSFGTFSLKEKTPALTIQTTGHRLDFRGRIDRIDLTQDGKHARVIDYKTEKIPKPMTGKRKTPLMAGERIQVAIYREALAAIEDSGKLELIEGEYLHVTTGEEVPVPIVFTNEELLEAGLRLREILEVMAKGMEAGVFFARTKGVIRPEGHCRFCDFLPICGKDREQREERKANDPGVLDFLKAQAIDGITVAEEE